MITDNEKFIEIQAILVSSNINTRDCAKINDLIIELSKENAEHNDKVVDKVNWENMLLKNQQKEFIKYLEDEKDRLARECSHIYEDSLGHTRLVNEDIFDEINDVLQKYREIIGE